VAVDLENDAKGIFDIDHTIRFFVWIIIADWHALFTSGLYNPFDKSFDIRVLNAKVERAVLAEIDIVFGRVIAIELKKFKAYPICRCKVCDAQFFPARTKHIGTHDANVAFVFGYVCGWHNDVKPKDLRIEFNGCVQIRDREADMRKCTWMLWHKVLFLN
tara:strand:+ start:106 stop:585 length:480 start_codon:yes stop_codon:yes gene_type:complete